MVKPMAPKAPMGANFTTTWMIPKKRWETESKTSAVWRPKSPSRVQAIPVRMAISRTWRRLPSAKAPKKASGITARRDSERVAPCEAFST